MASGDTLVVFTPEANEPPATYYATLDLRNGHPVLDFDATGGDPGDESALFTGVMPRNYAGGGVTVTLIWAASGVATGDVRWDVAFERMDTGTDLDDTGAFAAAQSATATCSGTDGCPVYTTVPFTNGAPMDSLAVGEAFRIKITRDGNNAADTMAADAELVAVEIKET